MPFPSRDRQGADALLMTCWLAAAPLPARPAEFRETNLAFVHPEVVRHLVPDGFADQPHQVPAVPGEALVGPLVESDAVGKGEAVGGAAAR